MSEDRPTPPSKPPIVVTSTGEHPAIIIQPEPRWQILMGFLLDLVALAGMFLLMALDKLTVTEGLPWIALLLGVKASSLVRGKGVPPSGGAGVIFSILGILGQRNT